MAWVKQANIRGPAGPEGPSGPLDGLSDVDVAAAANGAVLTKMPNGTWMGRPNAVSNLNSLTDVTAPAATPPNSLLGTVGDGMTAGVAEWEPMHLDYVQNVVLGPLPSTVADLGQRVTELEHTGEIVPPDLELTVDLYSTSFTRIIGADQVPATPSKRITVALATTPGPNGAIFATLADISGTGAVWADFAGNLGKVVDTGGTGINGAALKEAIRRGQIVTVHRGVDGSHPTLVVEKAENPADAGSSLTLDALKDVTAPASTPGGKVLGTTAEGQWGPIDVLTELPTIVDTMTAEAVATNSLQVVGGAYDGAFLRSDADGAAVWAPGQVAVVPDVPTEPYSQATFDANSPIVLGSWATRAKGMIYSGTSGVSVTSTTALTPMPTFPSYQFTLDVDAYVTVHMAITTLPAGSGTCYAYPMLKAEGTSTILLADNWNGGAIGMSGNYIRAAGGGTAITQACFWGKRLPAGTYILQAGGHITTGYTGTFAYLMLMVEADPDCVVIS